jgi:hypothetical protein
MAEDTIINIMAKNRNHHKNHIAIGPSIGMDIDVDIGSDNHASNYTDDPRNNPCNKHVNNDIIAHNNSRNDIAYSDNSGFSYYRPAFSETDNNNRAAIAEQGNLMSVAQSVRNLGFVPCMPNMNMNLNHQQMNALNVSLNAAGGAINNVNFPRLRNSMFVPDVNASLSNTNGFPNNHHANFSAESVSMAQTHNHNPFAMTEDNDNTAIHRGGHNGERYFGGQFGLTQGPLGDTATALNGHTSSNNNNNSDNKTENKRRGVEGVGVSNLPIAKRMRPSTQQDHLTTQEQQHQPSPATSGRWLNPASGRSYPLYVERDERNLSQYQVLARKQMEIFEATSEDAGNNAQGRNRPILPGQIGIRCRHCYKLSPKQRKTGSVYYPNRVRIVLRQSLLVFIASHLLFFHSFTIFLFLFLAIVIYLPSIISTSS